MDFEKKDDIDTKEILDNINSNVQVKNSKLPIILLALLYGTALYGFAFSIIENNRLGESSIVVVFALFIMIFVVMILQIRGVLSATKIEDIDYCLNTYFLYKYITAPFICGCVGILSYIIFEWISMTIKSDNQLATSILIFLFIAFIVVVVPYILASYVFIGLPCTVAVNCMLDITRKKCGMSFEDDTFFPANDTDSKYYRRFVYKYKILEKRYGVGYFDSCIQLYYNGHISVYILGNKVFRVVILWN